MLKKNQTVYYYNMFGIKTPAKVDSIVDNEVSLAIIHPDDADYDYDPNFRVYVKISKLIDASAPALRPLPIKK